MKLTVIKSVHIILIIYTYIIWNLFTILYFKPSDLKLSTIFHSKFKNYKKKLI